MRIRQWLVETIERLSDIATYPLKFAGTLFNKGIGLFHHQEVGDAGINEEKHWLKKLVTAPFFLLWFPVNVLKQKLRSKRLSEILVAVPALLMLAIIFVIGYRVVFASEQIQQLYYIGARKAISANNIDLAKKYFERIDETAELSDEMKHDSAIVLSMSGDQQKSGLLLEEIAPFGKKGLPAAHRSQAIRLAKQIVQSPDNDLLIEQLNWHLKNAMPSAQTDRIWARYYVFRNEPAEAVRYLDSAAIEYPQLYFSLAELCEELGRDTERSVALMKAKERFKSMLELDPLDQTSRISLANVLLKIGQADEAQKVMLTGLQIFKTPDWRRAVSVFVMKCSTQDSVTMKQRFELTCRALSFDVENRLVYSQFVDLCRVSSPSEKSELKSMLFNTITGEQSSGLAHVCLAYYYWREKNDSEQQWHLQQAANLDDQFELIVGNMATSFATHATPDFDWAIALANKCIERSPDDSTNYLRRAEIMLFQERYTDAILELKGILKKSDVTQERVVYERLAYAYSELGDLDQARSYSKKAELVDGP